MKRLIIANLILLAILTSCSSPESDGEKQAQEECELWDNYVQNTITAYTNFVKEFGSKNYQTRKEAREELNNRINEVESHLDSKLDELNAKYNALLEKYGEDRDETEALSRAYNRVIGAYAMDTTGLAGLRSQAYGRILTIIPPEPDKDKLEKDLIGRQVRSLPGGYLNERWRWTIKAGDIKDLQIVEVRNLDAHNKKYSVEMTLQSEGAAYKTSGMVYYVLDDRDDWEIDMLEPYEVEVIRTGRYDSSITVNISAYIMGKYLSIRNNSDAALLVGYQILDSYRGWEKHSEIISGGNTSSRLVPGLEDFKIDFVERP